MTDEDLNEPEQTEPNLSSPVVSNPEPHAFNITVSVPAEITVKMVDASGLSDYDFHIFFASLAFGIFTGFLVPSIQEVRAAGPLALPFCVMTALLFAMFVGFALMALHKRGKLTRSGREIKLKTTGAIVD